MNDEQHHTQTNSVTWFVLILQAITIAFLVSTRLIDAKIRAQYQESIKQYEKQTAQYEAMTKQYEKDMEEYRAKVLSGGR